jgi:hypothetical protein
MIIVMTNHYDLPSAVKGLLGLILQGINPPTCCCLVRLLGRLVRLKNCYQVDDQMHTNYLFMGP